MPESSRTDKTWLAGGRLWRWLLAAAWLALFAATHVPQDILTVPRGQGDKLAHFGGYIVLALLFAMAWQRSAGVLTGAHLRFAWIVLAIYGAIDELTQPLFGRHASMFDWLADVAGAAAGLALFRWLSKWQRGRAGPPEID